tara:strand:+ start:546 stop:1217 length:672 start_codon:yes stop_codon:yes gene_type:complete
MSTWIDTLHATWPRNITTKPEVHAYIAELRDSEFGMPDISEAEIIRGIRKLVADGQTYCPSPALVVDAVKYQRTADAALKRNGPGRGERGSVHGIVGKIVREPDHDKRYDMICNASRSGVEPADVEAEIRLQQIPYTAFGPGHPGYERNMEKLSKVGHMQIVEKAERSESCGRCESFHALPDATIRQGACLNPANAMRVESMRTPVNPHVKGDQSCPRWKAGA